MIELRGIKPDSIISIVDSEIEKGTITFFLSDEVGNQKTTRIRPSWDEVATLSGFKPTTRRVEYEDRSEDYITVYKKDGEEFRQRDFDDNLEEVAVIILRNKLFDRFRAKLL